MTDQQRMDTLLEFLTNQGADMLHRVFGADSCIASTAIALRVLDYFDVGAFAKPVKASLWTAAAFALLQQRPDDDIDFTGTMPGVYACAIEGTGKVSEGERWDGHLIAVVPLGDEMRLLDMTIGQFARPDKGLNVPKATVVELPQDFDPFTTSSASYIADDGMVLCYTTIPDIDHDGWQRSGDWRDLVGGIRALAALIIKAFRDYEKGYDIAWDWQYGGEHEMCIGHHTIERAVNAS